jgi:hypothetical protein
VQEIVMAIRGISSAIDTAKRISEAANASNNAGLVMAIADSKSATWQLVTASLSLGLIGVEN